MSFRKHFWSPRVSSDEGFSILPKIRAGEIIYSEGDRRVMVGADALDDGLIDIALPERPVWDVGGSSTPFSDEDRVRVLNNVRRALGFVGLKTSA